MRTNEQGTLRLELRLPGRDLLARLRRIPRLALRILRARVTRTDSWYELEVRGPQSAVARVLRLTPRLPEVHGPFTRPS